MFADQDGLCGICRKSGDKTLHVDHDHDTGAIRGLLCDLCNRGLGYFKDSSKITEFATNYLKKFKSF